MAAIITRAPRDPEACVNAPVKDDGSFFEWGMVLPGADRYGWSDDIPGLVSLLVGDPDYPALDEQDQLVARIRTALRYQVTTQALINVGAVETGEWDLLCEWERQVLNGPRHQPPNADGGFPTRNLFDGLDLWTAPTPLVVVSTASQPYTTVPPIFGTGRNLLTIDPVDDESLLCTFEDDLGLLRVFRRAEG